MAEAIGRARPFLGCKWSSKAFQKIRFVSPGTCYVLNKMLIMHQCHLSLWKILKHWLENNIICAANVYNSVLTWILVYLIFKYIFFELIKNYLSNSELPTNSKQILLKCVRTGKLSILNPITTLLYISTAPDQEDLRKLFTISFCIFRNTWSFLLLSLIDCVILKQFDVCVYCIMSCKQKKVKVYWCLCDNSKNSIL